jgi:hypothetical protein
MLKTTFFWIALLLLSLSLSGCMIPDLPGPIGIPGI